jgi:hypothetical protein
VDFLGENVTEAGFLGEVGRHGDEVHQISQIYCLVEWRFFLIFSAFPRTSARGPDFPLFISIPC